jgi:hypothetical protein
MVCVLFEVFMLFMSMLMLMLMMMTILMSTMVVVGYFPHPVHHH